LFNNNQSTQFQSHYQNTV